MGNSKIGKNKKKMENLPAALLSLVQSLDCPDCHASVDENVASSRKWRGTCSCARRSGMRDGGTMACHKQTTEFLEKWQRGNVEKGNAEQKGIFSPQVIRVPIGFL